MKTFFASFVAVFFLGLILIFLAGATGALSNFWFMFILPIILIAAIITGFINQSDKIEALEKRVAQLEQEKTSE